MASGWPEGGQWEGVFAICIRCKFYCYVYIFIRAFFAFFAAAVFVKLIDILFVN